MNRVAYRVIVSVCLLSLTPQYLAAQAGSHQFQAGVHFGSVQSSEFDENDLGAGGRLSWHPLPALGIESEMTFYPSNLGAVRGFDAGRVEGLFGATIGPRVGSFRPFAKLRPGFLTYRGDGPVACIQIYPPPLSCTLAAGHTAFALDAGGGVEWFPSGHTFVRVDAGDRLVRYPGPSFGSDREIHDEAFFGHDFRFAVGGGVRF